MQHEQEMAGHLSLPIFAAGGFGISSILRLGEKTMRWVDTVESHDVLMEAEARSRRSLGFPLIGLRLYRQYTGLVVSRNDSVSRL